MDPRHHYELRIAQIRQQIRRAYREHGTCPVELHSALRLLRREVAADTRHPWGSYTTADQRMEDLL